MERKKANYKISFNIKRIQYNKIHNNYLPHRIIDSFLTNKTGIDFMIRGKL